jgi:hypothetical protein
VSSLSQPAFALVRTSVISRFNGRDGHNGGPIARSATQFQHVALLQKKKKGPKVVLNREHIWRELVPIPRRALTEEEMEWVRQSLRPRAEFANFSIPQLFAIAKCPCETCRCVGLGLLELPNWKGKIRQSRWNGDSNEGPLPHRHTSPRQRRILSWNFEVIWYNFPQPFPESWEEVSRMPDPAPFP